jgi:glyoxylase-like metal-dependent hydrolase (beta-lactamase superfamily II)
LDSPIIEVAAIDSARKCAKSDMDKITTLDMNWVGHPRSIAAALLESESHRAIIDPGPESTLVTLREQLRARDISIADLDAILLTHIHLDHAGASGALVRENPRLAVYVHSKGAHHMADPAKLLASAGRLWGDDLKILFGQTLPVPQENLRILEGGENLELGARRLDVVYTPGHASHHVSYFDGANGIAFVGDTAGIRIDNGPYILPATPPPDIDLGLWDASFAAILKRQPARLFLTHYGLAENPPAHIAEFRDRLHHWVAVAEQSLAHAARSSTSSAADDSLIRHSATNASAPDKSRDAAQESAAMDAFVKKSRAEMDQHLGAIEAEHHAFTAALNLSFLGLARYIRKRTPADAH